MRKGFNPNKDKTLQTQIASHRVIIPIYIPNSEGYFTEAFDVLKVCVTSLLETINEDTKITLISNAATEEVNNYIKQLWEEGKIDRVVYNAQNVGKMNAIMAETRASFEAFITYADADVFFDKGWLKQTYTMFSEVPNAGFVSMNPTPKNLHFAEATLLSKLGTVLWGKKPVNQVCRYDDLRHFHESIDRDKDATDAMFNNGVAYLVYKKYIIGAGHFCCTIKKEPTLQYVPKQPSEKAVSGKSENTYLDIPFNKTGLYRLSSPKAFVWHMGNTLEKDWAEAKLTSLEGYIEDDFYFNSLPKGRSHFIIKLIPYSMQLLLVRILMKLNVIQK
jgi:hypothetical protein